MTLPLKRRKRGVPGSQKRGDDALAVMECRGCGDEAMVPKSVSSFLCGRCIQKRVAGVGATPKQPSEKKVGTSKKKGSTSIMTKVARVPREPKTVLSAAEAQDLFDRLVAGKTTVTEEQERRGLATNLILREALLSCFGVRRVRELREQDVKTYRELLARGKDEQTK